jgi:hypothetical protein
MAAEGSASCNCCAREVAATQSTKQMAKQIMKMYRGKIQEGRDEMSPFGFQMSPSQKKVVNWLTGRCCALSVLLAFTLFTTMPATGDPCLTLDPFQRTYPIPDANEATCELSITLILHGAMFGVLFGALYFLGLLFHLRSVWMLWWRPTLRPISQPGTCPHIVQVGTGDGTTTGNSPHCPPDGDSPGAKNKALLILLKKKRQRRRQQTPRSQTAEVSASNTDGRKMKERGLKEREMESACLSAQVDDEGCVELDDESEAPSDKSSHTLPSRESSTVNTGSAEASSQEGKRGNLADSKHNIPDNNVNMKFDPSADMDMFETDEYFIPFSDNSLRSTEPTVADEVGKELDNYVIEYDEDVWTSDIKWTEGLPDTKGAQKVSPSGTIVEDKQGNNTSEAMKENGVPGESKLDCLAEDKKALLATFDSNITNSGSRGNEATNNNKSIRVRIRDQKLAPMSARDSVKGSQKVPGYSRRLQSAALPGTARNSWLGMTLRAKTQMGDTDLEKVKKLEEGLLPSKMLAGEVAEGSLNKVPWRREGGDGVVTPSNTNNSARNVKTADTAHVVRGHFNLYPKGYPFHRILRENPSMQQHAPVISRQGLKVFRTGPQTSAYMLRPRGRCTQCARCRMAVTGGTVQHAEYPVQAFELDQLRSDA